MQLKTLHSSKILTFCKKLSKSGFTHTNLLCAMVKGKKVKGKAKMVKNEMVARTVKSAHALSSSPVSCAVAFHSISKRTKQRTNTAARAA